jgi:SAM-dependent methyltransferase
VAIAVHWFDLEKFFQEVHRVLQPGGILAVWTYHLPVIDPAIDAQVVKYYAEVLASYWPPKFHYVDERYQTLPFPFEELQPPPFEMSADWDLGQLVGFLNSWTAAHKYEGEHGQNPIKRIWQALAEAWGEPQQKRQVRWLLYLRVGSTSPDLKDTVSTAKSKLNNVIP